MVNVSGWSQSAALPMQIHGSDGEAVLENVQEGFGLNFELPELELILGEVEAGSTEAPADLSSMMLSAASPTVAIDAQAVAGEVVADIQLVEVEQALRQFDSQQLISVGVQAGSGWEVTEQALPQVIATGRPDVAQNPGLWPLQRGGAAPSFSLSDDPVMARVTPLEIPQLIAADTEGQFEKTVIAETLAVRSSASLPGIPVVTAGSLGTVNAAELGDQPRVAQLGDARWGEQFVRTLQEQVQLQVRQGMQTATIRLDPPELGQVEIRVSHEQGRLQVQIHAAQPDVVRLLNLMGDRLRSDLLAQQFEQVDLKFGGGSGQSRDGRGRDADSRPDPVLANVLPEQDHEARQTPRDDLLISV